jgi:hypothetical protein
MLDGLAAVCWVINMQNDVLKPRVKNISPGQLYTVIIEQDAAGNHLFTWPPVCRNAARVNPAANSTTVQNFIGFTGGLLLANIPGTWN